MILSQAQAEAVYSAMCALNNIGARIDTKVPMGGGIGTRVWEGIAGHVLVDGEFRGEPTAGLNRETYSDQAAFAAAYGLQ